ncbi:MAG: DNA-binding response regulator [Saprospirales bacterium]|nr:MAG: DNA-binding response regulator [Saprospirales bacterium]
MKILVIEDDLTLSQNIKNALRSEGYAVEVIYDGQLAERVLKKKQFDCVVLDINLPGKNGFDLCVDFRKYNTATPVIMLTAFGDLDDKVRGFDCGADDYLTKPFYMKELIIRVSTLLKRARSYKKGKSDLLVAGDIKIEDSSKKVTRQGREIKLTPREYQILYTLAENKGEVVSKARLVEEIWGRAFDANTNTIEVYINFLRNKIDKPFKEESIKTKIGYGYYLDLN